MTKLIFGFFAHPDDETFTSGGTLLLESKAGTAIHLVSLTDGSAGANPDAYSDLGASRLTEWKNAGDLLGIHSQHHFGYNDGELNNLAMIEIAQRIEHFVTDTLADIPADATVEFMALDLNGYTGHIDHIVASRAATLAFYRLKAHDTRLTRIRYSCLPTRFAPAVNTDWIYMDAGHPESEVDEVIDARHLHDEIIAAIHAHHSQRHDGETLIKSRGADLGLNYFIVKT